MRVRVGIKGMDWISRDVLRIVVDKQEPT